MVTTVHKEYGFSYKKKLDYDLDDIEGGYIVTGGGVAKLNHVIVSCVGIKDKGEKIVAKEKGYRKVG